MKKLSKSIIQHFTNFIQRVMSAFLGVNEILFLIGIGGLFRGVWGAVSFDVALIVCGALFIVVSLAGVIVSQRSPSK